MSFFNITEYIDPLAFFIALFIGLFITYVLAPPKKYVIKWPTPDNTDKNVYKDDADVCYKYKAEEVQCPSDKSKIQQVELQQIKKEKDPRDNTIVDQLQNIFDYEKKTSV